MNVGSSRHISLGELYTNLQIEYLSYRLRSRIYTRECDKKKFSDISEKKKEKIEFIARCNGLPSIFSSGEDYRKKYIDKFINEWGLPNFSYKDVERYKVYGYWDKIYYYNKGVDVKVRIGNSLEIGKIHDFDSENEVVIVLLNGYKSTIKINCDCVSRIIGSDFFEF